MLETSISQSRHSCLNLMKIDQLFEFGVLLKTWKEGEFHRLESL